MVVVGVKWNLCIRYGYRRTVGTGWPGGVQLAVRQFVRSEYFQIVQPRRVLKATTSWLFEK
jgi:hypothetical protein